VAVERSGVLPRGDEEHPEVDVRAWASRRGTSRTGAPPAMSTQRCSRRPHTPASRAPASPGRRGGAARAPSHRRGRGAGRARARDRGRCAAAGGLPGADDIDRERRDGLASGVVEGSASRTCGPGAAGVACQRASLTVPEATTSSCFSWV
jgi:hypothetical protein